MNIDLELELATNLWGGLPEEYRQRLRAVYENPCDETWEDAHSIILNAGRWLTLWQAVVAVDPTFPSSGPREDLKGRVEPWPRVPSRELLKKALYYATH